MQKKLEEVAKLHDARFYVVEGPYTGDNGAQIAWTGMLALRAGVITTVEMSRVRPKWRLEDVDIPWRNGSS